MLAAAVGLLQLVLPVFQPLLAAGRESYSIPESSASLASRVHGKAGGWAWMTPLLVAGVGLYKHVHEDEEFTLETVLNRQVVGGVLGDFALVALTHKIAPLLPIPPMFRAALLIGAGFVGWELGSGNLGQTDWVNLLAQVATATAIQVGLTAAAAGLGFPLGGVPIMLASMAGAIAVGILLDHWRTGPEAEAWERPGAPATGPPAARIRAGPAAPAAPAAPEDAVPEPAGAAVRRDLYDRLRQALVRGDRARAAALLGEYRALEGAASGSR